MGSEGEGVDMKLSVIVVSNNEEKVIGRCFKSVAWADERILVDDYSTDRTVKIAKKYDARVILRKLDTVGKQKQFALSKAKGDWILQLDADESISPELRNEIKEVLADPHYDAYNLYFHQYFLGDPLVPSLHGGHPRLFRKGHGWFSEAAYHVGPYVDVPVGQLETPIVHLSHQSISQLIHKFNKYTDADAQVLYDEGFRTSWFRIIVAPFYTFFYRQWKEKDFLSGVRGLVLSCMFSIHTLMKWLKLWEIEYKRGRKKSVLQRGNR